MSETTEEQRKRPPGTRLRNVRVDDDLWNEAKAIAHARGETLSADVVRPALERYVKKHREK